MTEKNGANQQTQAKQTKVNGKAKETPQAPGRVISDPKDVAQHVMMRIDQVNSKKDGLTIAVKGLADTAKQLVSVYAKQQAQITKLMKQVDELEKSNRK
jgi:glycerol-3-phosphate dehydrogenase